MNRVCSVERNMALPSQLLRGVTAILVGAALFMGVLQTAAQAQDDHVIVPGVRIGQISLGMTEGDLYKMLGDPAQSMSGRGNTIYTYPALTITVDTPTGKIAQIDTHSSDYATAEGIKIGSSGLAVKTQLGQYRARSNAPPGFSTNDYANGMTLMLNSGGLVQNIAVWSGKPRF